MELAFRFFDPPPIFRVLNSFFYIPWAHGTTWYMCQNGCFGGVFLVCQVMLTIGQAACGHCKVEEYELLFSCWASYGWGHVRTHTPPGATAKTVHHFYFNKDPPSFINATDAGAMAFKNECASVRSAGATLLQGSAKK